MGHLKTWNIKLKEISFGMVSFSLVYIYEGSKANEIGIFEDFVKAKGYFIDKTN